MKIVLATTNNSKYKPFLRAWELSGLKDSYELVMFDEFKSSINFEVEEDTGSFELDSLKKAKAYAHALNMPVISLDRGIEFEALQGWPGTKTKEVLAGNEKRILGVNELEEPVNEYERDIHRCRTILNKLTTNRTMSSVYGIAICFPDDDSCSDEVRLSGTASLDLRVTDIGYFYDWFFIPDGEYRTTSEFGNDELLTFQATKQWPITTKIKEYLLKKNTKQ